MAHPLPIPEGIPQEPPRGRLCGGPDVRQRRVRRSRIASGRPSIRFAPSQPRPRLKARDRTDVVSAAPPPRPRPRRRRGQRKADEPGADRDDRAGQAMPSAVHVADDAEDQRPDQQQEEPRPDEPGGCRDECRRATAGPTFRRSDHRQGRRAQARGAPAARGRPRRSQGAPGRSPSTRAPSDRSCRPSRRCTPAPAFDATISVTGQSTAPTRAATPASRRRADGSG